METPLFQRAGERFIPSEHARGPWSPEAQHGGPPAALVVRALEALPADAPMSLARVTLEILGPVPLAPLSLTAAVERPGRRVQLVSATVLAEDVEVCRALGWRLRVTDLGDVLGAPEALPFPAPRDATPADADPGPDAFHRTGVEMRYVRGSLRQPGPCVAWIRLRRPVVDDEMPSPAMRTVAAADFGNGISSVVSWERYGFLNTDLTVYLHRHPDGEWVCLDATTHAERAGVAVAASRLYDERGRIGLSAQTLLVEPRASGLDGTSGNGVP